MKNFALFQGYIVTANPDGSVPLNAKVACGTLSGDPKILCMLIAQANLAKDLAEALDAQRKDAAVTVAFQKYHGEVGTP